MVIQTDEEIESSIPIETRYIQTSIQHLTPLLNHIYFLSLLAPNNPAVQSLFCSATSKDSQPLSLIATVSKTKNFLDHLLPYQKHMLKMLCDHQWEFKEDNTSKELCKNISLKLETIEQNKIEEESQSADHNKDS